MTILINLEKIKEFADPSDIRIFENYINNNDKWEVTYDSLMKLAGKVNFNKLAKGLFLKEYYEYFDDLCRSYQKFNLCSSYEEGEAIAFIKILRKYTKDFGNNQ